MSQEQDTHTLLFERIAPSDLVEAVVENGLQEQEFDSDHKNPGRMLTVPSDRKE